MKSNHNRLLHLVLIVMLAVASAVIVTPASAAAVITVAPAWHPGQQLTTLITGPGAEPAPRYVDADVYVTTNTQFWSVQLTCTVMPAVLQAYVFDPTGLVTLADPGDDVKMVTWGGAWGSEGGTFAQFTSGMTGTGAITAAASRMGSATPMGSNGLTQSLLLATFHYKVATTAGTSTFMCTSTFLDRNGVAVGTATYTAPAALSVIAGYTISGTVSYQARTAKIGIGVRCQGPSGPPIDKVTDAMGKFSITTRALGQYSCTYFGNITTPGVPPHNDIYLQGPTGINLSTQSYALLPVTLNGGNVDMSASPTLIDPADITKVTSNYNSPTVTTFLTGDVNGDGKTNQVDLSIASANFDLSNTTSATHVLFGLARTNIGAPDYFDIADNRIWLGNSYSNAVTPVGASSSRDFWPTLAPNGSKIAFTREVPFSGGFSYLLFTMNPDGTGVTQLTKPVGADYQFAPSWSPDSTRIAYDCTTYDDNGFPLNRTSICVVDATGRNQLAVAFDADIYPPAWLTNSQLLFGGHCGTGGALTICKVDLSTFVVNEFSSEISTGSGRTNDYPSVFANTLFYRTNDGGGPASIELRMADIIPGTPQTISPLGTNTAGQQHASLNVSTDVDYYAISTDGQRNVMYYEGGDHSCSGHNFNYVNYNAGTPPTWTAAAPSLQSIYDAYCNPFWDGNTTHYTGLWAQRNTINWVP